MVDLKSDKKEDDWTDNETCVLRSQRGITTEKKLNFHVP